MLIGVELNVEERKEDALDEEKCPKMCDQRHVGHRSSDMSVGLFSRREIGIKIGTHATTAIVYTSSFTKVRAAINRLI